MEAKVNRLEGKRIVCVDDDGDWLGLCGAVFSGQEKASVREFCSAEGVVEYLQENETDLLILDLYMPLSNGWELCCVIRNIPELHGLPILMISASDRIDDVMRCMTAGADDYLVKPVFSGELVAKALLVMQRRQTAVAAAAENASSRYYSDRYELRQRLGSGSSSDVFYALDHNCAPPRGVALKLLSRNHFDRDGNMAFSELIREAYVHVQLDNPNIVKLLDIGQSHGRYFLVLEHVVGANLEELVSESGPMPESIISLIGHCVTSALLDIEGHLLVHRDIKSKNIMVTSSGDVRLVDFGLATPQCMANMEANKEVVCTPLFTAPEVANGAVATIASDIYAMGVVLYHTATAKFPINATNAVEVLRSQMEDPFDPIEVHRQGLDSRLVDAIESCLAKTPSERPSLRQLEEVFLDLCGEV